MTRTTDIKPELLVATWKCNECQREISGVQQEFKVTSPAKCPTKNCGNTTNWKLLAESRSTRWGDWQRIRLQENEHEVPAGSMPQTMDVIVRDECTEKCKAGDKVQITGSLIVVPDVPTLMSPGELKATVRRSLNTRQGCKRFRTCRMSCVDCKLLLTVTRLGVKAHVLNLLPLLPKGHFLKILQMTQEFFSLPARSDPSYAAGEGVRGLKAVGNRDLTYKLAFYGTYIDEARMLRKRIFTFQDYLDLLDFWVFQWPWRFWVSSPPVSRWGLEDSDWAARGSEEKSENIRSEEKLYMSQVDKAPCRSF